MTYGTEISRDPFARQSTERRTLTGHSCEPHEGPEPQGFGDRLYTCDWCGRVRRTRTGKPQAYRYATVTDGGRTYEHVGSFCSKGCHDAYHDILS